jgi:CRISPR-associated endonuclease Cas2
MGQIEERGRIRARRRNLKNGILAAVQAAALIGTAIAAPALPMALYKLGIIPRNYHSSTVARARQRYISQGLLKIQDGRLRLTPKGVSALSRLTLERYGVSVRKRWDGRWRVLIFDVPEYRKGVRDKVRRTLISVGFKQLQKSVWVYPHDCEDFVVLLKADLKIGKDVLYLIVDELENDRWLKKEFELRSA